MRQRVIENTEVKTTREAKRRKAEVGGGGGEVERERD